MLKSVSLSVLNSLRFLLPFVGSTYPERVVSKDLNDDDYAVFKYFQGISQATLKKLIFTTPIDTDKNRDLFKRVFLLYIKKCFLLPTLAANISPRALPTIFNLENTRHQNWALHIHNFLLEEVQKAKDNNTSFVSGCCFVLMVFYFHETHFGKNSREAKAQPPWIQYWTGKTLWDRMVQEKTIRPVIQGLIRTAKAPLTNKGKHKKNTKNGSSSESEYISSDSVYEEGYDFDSEMTRSETIVRVERNSKRKNDSVPAPVPVQRVHDPDSYSDDQETLGHAMLRRKRKNVEGHRIQSRRTRKRGNSPTHSNAESTNQFLYDNKEPHQQQQNQPPKEEGTQPPPTQPQPQQPPQEEVPQKQQQQQHQGEIIDISLGSELEPEPIPLRVLVPKVEADLEASPRELLLIDTLLRLRKDEQPSKEDDNGPALQEEEEEEEEQQQQQQEEEEEKEQQQPQKRNNLHNLLLKPIPATQEVIEINSDDEDPEPRPMKMLIPKTQVEDEDFEERVATWATVPKGGNDYELIFDLKGPRTLKAMRFQFDSMAPKSYIDIQVVGLMCHILNGEEGERMLEAHHHNWIDKKKRRPHEITSLTNHKEFLSFIDREKILSHRFCFAPVLYSKHWWLYVMDKNGPEGPEMFVLDSKNISSPTEERTTLNKFVVSVILLKSASPF
ncbi:hypothetical protein PIB30_012932 [Stylosanthes scabra]|uniref:Ubiquitin-like protease family profile domain-containing protein n=1 Tax=Stylosanthes scabra TaxID=79078 RepID=A0ABU6Y6J5_9FABA|nr:hypothetical protein [Stylosanthes scabra]